MTTIAESDRKHGLQSEIERAIEAEYTIAGFNRNDPWKEVAERLVNKNVSKPLSINSPTILISTNLHK